MCDITPAEIKLLSPLLTMLGLDATVHGVKQLLVALNKALGGILAGPLTQAITDAVNGLILFLLGGPLDLHDTVGSLSVTLGKIVNCLADPLP